MAQNPEQALVELGASVVCGALILNGATLGHYTADGFTPTAEGTALMNEQQASAEQAKPARTAAKTATKTA